MKAKTLRFRFGLRTALGAVAMFAVTLALLDAWLLAPYRAEQHAATTLMQRGGQVVLVDYAPRWLRGYVGEDVLNMRVAASIDLSHSRVTDADLVHVLAFRHFGQLNLSDTAVGDAGLVHLRKVVAGRFFDLSRTRVTDVSILFGDESREHPLGLKLAGNRIARLFPFERQWCPLQELDLSHTNTDDGTLETLPDGLVNLSSLDLSGTDVSDDGLVFLSRLEGLTRLNLTDTRVTAEGVARLKSRWRGTRPLMVLTGTMRGTGSAPKGPSDRGSSGISVR
jgi:hypothetical protein